MSVCLSAQGVTDHPEAVSFATRATIEEFAGDGVRWSYCFCPYLWDKAWVKPQGFVVKVFPRKVSKYTQVFPREVSEGSQKIFWRQT